MGDLLGKAVKHLRDKLKEHASREVIYRRGSDSIEGLKVTLGRSLLKLGDEQGGSRIHRTERDYLIPTADLVLESQLIAPQVGDKIVDAGDDDGIARIWEVRSPGGTEPHAQNEDARRILTRVHTKLVGTE